MGVTDKGRSRKVGSIGSDIRVFEAATHHLPKLDTTHIHRGTPLRMDEHESPSQTHRDMFIALPDTPRGALHAEPATPHQWRRGL